MREEVAVRIGALIVALMGVVFIIMGLMFGPFIRSENFVGEYTVPMVVCLVFGVVCLLLAISGWRSALQLGAHLKRAGETMVWTGERGGKPPTLQEIGEWVDEQRIPCDCAWRMNIKGDVILQGSSIKNYNHDAGWKVKGYPELQWVYVHCTVCGYDWALWKLINRAKACKLHPEMYR